MSEPSVVLWMPRASEIPGGHRTQLEKTAEALARLGLDVATSSAPALGAHPDVVHGFWLRADEVRLARRSGARVALSTIYWPLSYTRGEEKGTPNHSHLRPRLIRTAKSSFAALRNDLRRMVASEFAPVAQMMLAYESADVLLPNAVGEAQAIRRDLGVTTPTVVVPNAIDPAVFGLGIGEDLTWSDRSGVLCVGRLEPHKNQLGLARACRTLGVPLTLVGAEHPHHPGYARRCMEANPELQWLGAIEHDDLAPTYRQSRVHALCSWFETTGLSSLEAAALGCSVLSTSRGFAAEYLQSEAHYCDPLDQRSIEHGLRRALDTPPDPRLRARVLSSYTWEECARATATAYQIGPRP